MIELKGKYNKDCKIFADDIEESAYSLIQNILDEKATKNGEPRTKDRNQGIEKRTW